MSKEELEVEVADVEELIPKMVAPVIHAREPVAFGDDISVEYRPPFPGAPTVTVPKMGRIEGEWIPVEYPAAPTTFAEATIETVTIKKRKLRVPLRFSREVIQLRQLDVLGNYQTLAGRAIQRKVNELIVTEALGAYDWTVGDYADASTKETFTISAGATEVKTLAKKPVLEIEVDSGVPTISRVDYYDGEVEFTNPDTTTDQDVRVLYTYSTLPAAQILDAKTAGELKYEDFVTANVTLRSKFFQPTVAIINEEDKGSVLVDAGTRFKEVGVYGEAVVRGEIGMYAGFRIIATTEIPQGVVLYLDREIALGRTEFDPLRQLEKADPGSDAIELYYYLTVGAKRIVDEAIVISVNHAPNAAKL